MPDDSHSPSTALARLDHLQREITRLERENNAMQASIEGHSQLESVRPVRVGGLSSLGYVLLISQGIGLLAQLVGMKHWWSPLPPLAMVLMALFLPAYRKREAAPGHALLRLSGHLPPDMSLPGKKQAAGATGSIEISLAPVEITRTIVRPLGTFELHAKVAVTQEALAMAHYARRLLRVPPPRRDAMLGDLFEAELLALPPGSLDDFTHALARRMPEVLAGLGLTLVDVTLLPGADQ